MPQGEGVAVHYRRAGHARHTGPGQGVHEVGHAMAAVLHQQHVLRPGHRIEEQILEHPAVFRLGVEKQVVDPVGKGLLAQLRQHGGAEPLALMARRRGDILQHAAVPGAGGCQRIPVPEEHRVFRLIFRAQALRFQQRAPGGALTLTHARHAFQAHPYHLAPSVYFFSSSIP